MRILLFLFMTFSFGAFALAEDSEIACFSDMTDGACQVREESGRYLGTCVLEVNVQYKSGKRELLVLKGFGSVRKHKVVLFLETEQKEQAMGIAYSDLYGKIIPFFSIESCR